MDFVQAFIDDSNANKENFEAKENGDDAADIVINDYYHFKLPLAAPYTFEAGTNCSKTSKAIKNILARANDRKDAASKAPKEGLAEALKALTAAYQKYTDDLDAEAADEMGMNTKEEEDEDAIEKEQAKHRAAVAAAKEKELAKLTPEERKKKEMIDSYIEQMKNAPKGQLNPAATLRVLTDLARIKSMEGPQRGWSCEPYQGSLQNWVVKLTAFDKGYALDKDMDRWARETNNEKAIVINMRIANNHPYKAPYMRVIRPQFMFRTGHVTMGGAICLLPLTDEGWNASFEMESIIEMVRTNILDSNAAVDHDKRGDYNESEAKDGFMRLVATHGWKHQFDF